MMTITTPINKKAESRLKSVLKNKKGEGYIGIVVLVLVCMMIIMLALNVFKLLSVKQDLDYYAKEMLTIATMKGITRGEAIDERKAMLTEETGLTPTITYTANEFDGSGKVQCGEKISVELTCDTNFEGFGSSKLPLTISASYSGIAENYWK